MSRMLSIAFAWLICLYAHFSLAAGVPKLLPPDAAVGSNLQTYAKIALSEAAPTDLDLTLTSMDPGRLLLAKMPENRGSASINVKVRAGFRESLEFWLQALAGSGQVEYTVSVPGAESGKGTVTLSPSGIAVTGPAGIGAPEFTTTPRGWPSTIKVRIVRLDSSLKAVEQQYLRGGFSVDVRLTSSNPAVGTIVSPIHIDAVGYTAVTEFRPASVGRTTLTASALPGFSTPADSGSVIANVRVPGLAVATEIVIGENLQVAAALSLGEPAPEGGIPVTITSSDPEKVLLSTSATEKGTGSITIDMPAGSVSKIYYLQSLANAGTVTNTASARGFVTRTGTITLAPSGVIIAVPGHGLPDEAEYFRPASAGGKQNLFVALLSENKSVPLAVYTAYMDPGTRRTADITVEALRAGLQAQVKLENTNPEIGTIDAKVTIEGGAERALVSFQPKKVGQTVISLVTPDGFKKPSNATEMLAIVQQ